MLTMLAMDMGTVLGIAVYVESVFRLGGLGSLAVFALGGTFGYDLPLILGIVVIVAIIVMALTLLADVAAALIDPRLKEQWASGSAMRALRPSP